MEPQRPLRWAGILGVASALLVAAGAGPATQRAAGAGEDRATALIEQMLETYRAMSAFQQSSTHVMKLEMGGSKDQRTVFARLVYRKPNRFLYEILDPGAGSMLACDGKSLWIYYAALGSYTLQYAPSNMQELDGRLGSPERSLLDAFAFLRGTSPLRDAQAVRFLGRAKLSGVPVAVVEVRGGPAEMGLGDSTTRLYIGDKDHLLYKSETRQIRGTPPSRPGEGVVKMSRVITKTHSGMKVNRPIADTAFTFRPPRGARQVASF
jgi:outer membrane lipoprotein-sorting protein